MNFCSPDWARTSDIRINSPPFYQLNYRGILIYIYQKFIYLSNIYIKLKINYKIFKRNIDYYLKFIYSKRYKNYYGPLAQWLEQATHNRLVAGSNPARAIKTKKLTSFIYLKILFKFFIIN